MITCHFLSQPTAPVLKGTFCLGHTKWHFFIAIFCVGCLDTNWLNYIHLRLSTNSVQMSFLAFYPHNTTWGIHRDLLLSKVIMKKHESQLSTRVLFRPTCTCSHEHRHCKQTDVVFYCGWGSDVKTHSSGTPYSPTEAVDSGFSGSYFQDFDTLNWTWWIC